MLRCFLLPLATVATPNLDEASVLLDGLTINQNNQKEAARALFTKYSCAILLKGGHLKGDPIDLFYDGSDFHRWTHPRIQKVNTHGSGCMLSAAIAAELAKETPLVQAISLGLERVHQALSLPTSLTSDLRLANVESLS